MEKAVKDLKLSRSFAAHVLVALCSRADASTTRDASTSLTSAEGQRLMPSLRILGLENASKALKRNIFIRDGELIVSAFQIQTEIEDQQAVA